LFAAWDIKIAYAFLVWWRWSSPAFLHRAVGATVIRDLASTWKKPRDAGRNPPADFLARDPATLAPHSWAGMLAAFIRSLGEFGAVVMIAGNIPFQTEVTSLMIFVRLQEFDYPAAAAIASIVLLASLLLLFGLQVAQVS
jgi:sulfate transport system permease protein